MTAQSLDSSATPSTALSAFNHEADIVIVGFGGAGACAALEALEGGADVFILDRFHGGGATAISGGVFYAGGGTPIQKDAGVEDTPEDMFRYLQAETKGIVSDETLRRFVDSSVDNLAWLRQHGVPFEGSLCPVKTSYPTDKYYLYYSGNESFPPWNNLAKPAARGHRAKGVGLPGANFYEPLRQSAEKLGARVSYESTVTKLLTDEQGAIIGVEYKALPAGSPQAKLHRKLNERATKLKNYVPNHSRKLWRQADQLLQTAGIVQRVRARKGVILSAGGFIFNREMVREHAPNYAGGMPLGTWADDGAGIRLGQEAGGSTDHMNRVSAWRFINPPMAWTAGVVVNKEGQRYVNESLYGAAIGEEMVERNGGHAYLIIDAKMFKEARSQVLWGRAQFFQSAPALLNMYTNAKKGKTLAEAAKAARLPADAVQATVDAYNAATRSGSEDPFGKFPQARQVLEKGPFYIMDVGVRSKRFPCPTLTLGGLRVNEDTGGVLDDQGQTIPGLYAAGRNAVGVASRQYVSGLSIADCVFSGRRASRAIIGA